MTLLYVLYKIIYFLLYNPQKYFLGCIFFCLFLIFMVKAAVAEEESEENNMKKFIPL